MTQDAPKPGARLPSDFSGRRTISEAATDLFTIAQAQPPVNEVHLLLVRPGGGVLGHATGTLTLEDVEGTGTTVAVGEVSAVITVGDFLGARLSTFDGSDYFALRIDTRRATIELSDAYNGLGGPPTIDPDDDHQRILTDQISGASAQIAEATRHANALKRYTPLTPATARTLDQLLRQLAAAEAAVRPAFLTAIENTIDMRDLDAG